MSTAVTTQRPRLVQKFADRFGVDPQKLLNTLKATAFRQKEGVEVTDEQMMALLVVADQYNLNPFTKEIYAYPDKNNGIVPIVGVDGWARIVNEHPQCDGFEFRQADESIAPEGTERESPVWMECVMYRKDRSRPTVVREFLDEVYRKPFKGNGKNGPYTIDGPWQTHPKRFLRHKTFVQTARLVFGFAGIHDEDEAQRIIERDMGTADEVTPVVQPQSRSQKRATPAPAIEHADQDGVIQPQMQQQREREPVQQNAEPTQRSAPRAARGKPDQEQFEDAPRTPVSDSVMRILQTKMEQNGINEKDIEKHFGFDLDGVTTANYNKVVEFVENPMAG